VPRSSRRRARHRHDGPHDADRPGYPEPGWNPAEQWYDPADEHAGWAAPRHHEPAPWRSEPLPEWDRFGDPEPGWPPEDGPASGRHRIRNEPYPEPVGHYRAEPYELDDGYEQHGPDETPALLGRMVRLPRRRADLPEAVRDCLRWGIFAIVLVPIFLIATGGSVLNAILVVLSILGLGIVVVGVVRLGHIALPNLEPAHQLQPIEPEVADPIETEWQDPPLTQPGDPRHPTGAAPYGQPDHPRPDEAGWPEPERPDTDGWPEHDWA